MALQEILIELKPVQVIALCIIPFCASKCILAFSKASIRLIFNYYHTNCATTKRQAREIGKKLYLWPRNQIASNLARKRKCWISNYIFASNWIQCIQNLRLIMINLINFYCHKSKSRSQLSVKVPVLLALYF